MKLIEADGKCLLREAGIACPPSVFLDLNLAVADDGSDLGYPLYLKAQVLQGRRGARGWIKRCSDVDEYRGAIADLREALRDVPCAGFLLESETPHVQEWLVSVMIGETGQPVASYSATGGIDVAAVTNMPVASSADVALLDVPAGVKNVLVKLVDAFFKNDALSMEINPLAIQADGSYVALDAKIELDDAAAFRHPEWEKFHTLSESGRRSSEREEAYAKLQEQAGHHGTLGRYVELDGDIALVLSGGGASLVAIDALKAAGGKPANYVEMSGNPDSAAVREAAKIVLSKPNIRAIWIAGSFANFTDIQATVGATLQVIAELGLTIPVVIRRDGPNAAAAKEDAMRWATERRVSIRFDRADTDLDASARVVVARSKGV